MKNLKVDPIVNFALIVTLISFISPIVVNIFNNRHLLKMKELDVKQENFKIINLHKREIFENFLSQIGLIIYSNNSENLSKLIISYYLILPYVSKDKIDYFRQFSTYLVETKNYNEELNPKMTDLLHNHIVPTIKTEIEKIQRP